MKHFTRTRKVLALGLPLVAVMGLGFSGCKGKNNQTTKEGTNAQSGTAGLQGPVAAQMREINGTPELVEKGKGHFATCAACHGAQGEGVVGVGPRLNSESFLAAASDQMLKKTISEGRQGTTMVGWVGSLQAEGVDAVVAYIRSWNDTKPAELNESPLNGDEAAGGKLFSDICAGCHGNNGFGYQETANGTGIGRTAFMGQVSNGYLRYIIKHGKSQTKMRGFEEGNKVAVANLTDQQIDDVIVYLRKNAK